MRIVSGKYKSRRIQVPPNLKARPTTDFAKENLFNILNNRIDWEETTALDLFSGTGSIALELVSRGCPYVVSVEQNQNHFNFICHAQEKLGAKELFPVRADAFKYLQSLKQPFGFIFADPPYDLTGIDLLPAVIFERKLLKPDGLFVLEHSRKFNFSQLPYFEEERAYGSVHFSFFTV
ncbi:RsmD family RNA methyltransferase [Proteiniphilum sp. UBA1028]|jgi:16S rRNA (guanine(966)-N(2))-methyltransferase RsmD|uniref:RsmD family RNA methyltransferase n=1 Tax=Proteiniphilum sp. UBA1028 TaxID=1947251 RepID=UPI000E800E5D|nr:RsmD family RNA methyltransferase [Proteiniphilum sp. UBA1028]HBG58453.1 16S rRNA (guanine(966)-N(2))-methyltransferase RsmD [Porphyromonadaceae bacterium]